jgi:hypothetical protein
MNEIDAYILNFPEDVLNILRKIRKLICNIRKLDGFIDEKGKIKFKESGLIDCNEEKLKYDKI